MNITGQEAITDSGRRVKHQSGYSIRSSRAREAFWENFIQTDDGCWEWQGYRDTAGYGRSGYGFIHRVTYTLLEGPIPDGLDIDHLCRNRGCGNPGHFEPVTHYENCRRGKQAQQTHCVNGHSLDPADDHLVMRFRRDGSPYRQCHTCCAIRSSNHRRADR